MIDTVEWTRLINIDPGITSLTITLTRDPGVGVGTLVKPQQTPQPVNPVVDPNKSTAQKLEWENNENDGGFIVKFKAADESPVTCTDEEKTEEKSVIPEEPVTPGPKIALHSIIVKLVAAKLLHRTPREKTIKRICTLFSKVGASYFIAKETWTGFNAIVRGEYSTLFNEILTTPEILEQLVSEGRASVDKMQPKFMYKFSPEAIAVLEKVIPLQKNQTVETNAVTI